MTTYDLKHTPLGQTTFRVNRNISSEGLVVIAESLHHEIRDQILVWRLSEDPNPLDFIGPISGIRIIVRRYK